MWSCEHYVICIIRFSTSSKSHRQCFFFFFSLNAYQFGSYGIKTRSFGHWQLVFKMESLSPHPPLQLQTHFRKLKAAKWSSFPGYNHLTILLPMGMLTESSPKWHFVICHTYAWLHPAKEQEATWVLFVKGMIWVKVVMNKSTLMNKEQRKFLPIKKNAFFLYSIKEIIKKGSTLFDTVNLFELSRYTWKGVLCLWKGRSSVFLG